MSTPDLKIGKEVVKDVDHFTYLTTSDRLISDEISTQIRDPNLALTNLHHLWCRQDIHLLIEGRVYCAVVSSFILYGYGSSH